jgi:hypothetical protein
MKGNYKHGMRHTRIYNIWRSMRQRCSNPNCINYHNYGGKGITVCDEWNDSFELFYEWAKKSGYKDGLTLDRKDADGNYEPSNCRWATQKEQQNNRTNNRLIEFQGETHTLGEWSTITGIKLATIWNRLKCGWSVEDALTRKPIVGTNRFSSRYMKGGR